MPSTLNYPGVYIEEIPSGVHTIAGVSTSDTAFVDFFAEGPMNQAVRVTGMQDFDRRYGGLDTRSEASYAIQQFFANGGQTAWVVRVAAGTPAKASLNLADGGSLPHDAIGVSAANEGVWGKNLQIGVDYATLDAGTQFNLTVRELGTVRGTQAVVDSETFRNLTMDKTSASYSVDVVNATSQLIQITDLGMGERPASTAADVTSPAAVAALPGTGFTALGGTPSDGNPPDHDALVGGLAALETIAPFVFNILCLPATVKLTAGLSDAMNAAATFAEDHRAFYIVDVPATVTLDTVAGWKDTNLDPNPNAAVYFPRLQIADPLNGNRPRDVGPSGTLAGIYARIDSTRGIWKAPAGTEAVLTNATLPTKLTDDQNGGLNPLGINVLRTFPVFGNVAWGARTLLGADIQTSEWKYIPVRRTALYIEESLFQGLKWVVFEPNDEPLWSQIRLNVGTFMQDLFRQGAFQGTTPRDAYFVKCDSDTTAQSDIDRGIVNILVGFAPLKPAEFVVLKIQQIAGQLES
jgi:phage tail sheath protein FI